MRSILILVLLIFIGGFCLHLENFEKIRTAHGRYHIASHPENDLYLNTVNRKQLTDKYAGDGICSVSTSKGQEAVSEVLRENDLLPQNMSNDKYCFHKSVKEDFSRNRQRL